MIKLMFIFSTVFSDKEKYSHEIFSKPEMSVNRNGKLSVAFSASSSRKKIIAVKKVCQALPNASGLVLLKSIQN